MPKINYSVRIALVIAAALFLPSLAWGQTSVFGSRVTGYKVPAGVNTAEISIWDSSCKTVTNSSGLDYFIPTSSAEEWIALSNNLPELVSIGECVSPCLGDKSDSSVTISVNSVVNDYARLTAAVDSLSTSIPVSSVTGFAVGDEVMIIQMSGASVSDVGKYEFVKIQAIGLNSLMPVSNLQNSYAIGSQVISVPQYDNLTINSGVSISPTAWDGLTGGIVAFKVGGTLTVNGSIDASAKGYRGGPSQTTNYYDGFPGESTTGMQNVADTAQTGKAAGGGPGGKDSGGGTYWGGGGLGGGYGTTGSSYPAQPSAFCGATGAYSGGGAYGEPQLTNIYLGSGGGSGGRQNDGAGSGIGGAGGGAVMVFTDNLVIGSSGYIRANGGAGGTAPSTAMGCGGGGSGGSVFLYVGSGNPVLGTSHITATGGTVLSICGSSRCNSSAGGRGRIALYSNTPASGNTNPTNFLDAPANANCSAASASYQCSAGYYLTTSLVCSLCTAGYYCPGDDEQYACGANNKWSDGGDMICSTILCGNYTTGGTSSTRTGAEICPANYFCIGDGTQTSCSAGTLGPVSDPGSCALTDCHASTCSCAVGYYDNAGICTACGANSVYCPGDCAQHTASAGYYTTGGTPTTRTGQVICEAGNYCVSGVKTQCPCGYAGLATGLTSSTCSGACSAGTYSALGDSSCSSCGTGANNAAGSCACSCAAGYYLSGSTCLACGGNQYYCTGNNIRNTVSTGYYSTGGTTTTRTGQSQCTCGYYCDSGVRSTCLAGYYGSTNGLTSSSCTGACGANNLYSAGGTCSCSAVSPGEYTTGGTTTTRTGKATCEAGYYCPGDGSRIACAAGYTSPVGSDAANDCYLSANCGAGYYLNGTCICTEGGYYSPANDNNRYICPTGAYCASCSSSPTYCSAGTANSNTGSSVSTACANCAAGYWSLSGSSSCYTCAAGYDDNDKNGTCTLTTAGYYSPANDYRRYICVAGKYSTGGASSCSNCAGGYYGEEQGMTSSTCSGCCFSGYYCPAGSTSPTQNSCAFNKTSAPMSDAVADCVTCATGTFFVDAVDYDAPILLAECHSNSHICYTCPAGSYCASGVRYNCPAGTYNPNTGASSVSACLACPVGYYCDGATGYYTYE